MKVSVIIPVFNSAATISRAIDSALAQDFEPKEIIVVNDGSTDGTAAELARYGDKICVIEQENQRIAIARNAAIKRSEGEYLALLDADDIWLPGRLSKTVEALERNPAAGLAFSNYSRIGPNGELIEHLTISGRSAHAPSMDEMLTQWWRIAPSTVTMRRSVWEQCGGFRPGLGGYEDIYLFTLARECGEFVYVDEPLVKFQVSPADTGIDKWNPKGFIRLIRERYGARSGNLIAEIQNAYAGAYAYRALQEMERGNRRAAIRSWAKALRCDPVFMLRQGRAARIFLPRNLRRIFGILRRWGEA